MRGGRRPLHSGPGHPHRHGPASRSLHGHPSGRLTITRITGTKGQDHHGLLYTNPLWTLGEPVRGLRESAIPLHPSSPTMGWSRRPAKLTTPNLLDLQRHLLNAVTAGSEYVTMEFSSQALKYGRVIGVDPGLRGDSSTSARTTSPQWSTRLGGLFCLQTPSSSGRPGTACVNLDCDHAADVRRPPPSVSGW